ncbi:MAG TPA: NAD(P)/FAD-dependent oxidoreductase [Candidatus Acidoferrales bacterium]|nr:NAD(P)/FAD-dependent oxidoreductase [Candidatus Acidoferrales bacterium]
MPDFDAVIIGGGPAGSTAARLLAEWGHSVTILTTAFGSRPSFAECLPPSTRKLFVFLGVQDAIDRARFFRTTGNTVWWGKVRSSGTRPGVEPYPGTLGPYSGRIEPYPEGRGYQVQRSEFDSLLLGLARDAGVQVQFGKAVGSLNESGPHVEFQCGASASESRSEEVQAKFVLDCSGRAGVLGRFLRARQPSIEPSIKKEIRTVALCAAWRSESGWKLPDPSHTLVESYGDGWAWSVPLSPSIRHVAVMVDPVAVLRERSSPGPWPPTPGPRNLAARYHAELAKTLAFRRIFGQSLLDGAPFRSSPVWGRPASCYTSTQFCGPGFLLAGDAGSIIDPLSSFGVKKAMVSGWVGAVVANTCLRNPAMQDTALRFYEDREREVYDDWQKLSASWFSKGLSKGFHNGGDHPFWEDRAGLPGSAANTVPPPRDAARVAWEALKRQPSIRLRQSGLPLKAQAAIEGNQIVLRDAMLGTVNLVRLSQIAGHHSQVPDVFEAYNRTCPPVALPNFLAALATLIAEKVLTDQP